MKPVHNADDSGWIDYHVEGFLADLRKRLIWLAADERADTIEEFRTDLNEHIRRVVLLPEVRDVEICRAIHIALDEWDSPREIGASLCKTSPRRLLFLSSMVLANLLFIIITWNNLPHSQIIVMFIQALSIGFVTLIPGFLGIHIGLLDNGSKDSGFRRPHTLELAVIACILTVCSGFCFALGFSTSAAHTENILRSWLTQTANVDLFGCWSRLDVWIAASSIVLLELVGSAYYMAKAVRQLNVGFRQASRD